MKPNKQKQLEIIIENQKREIAQLKCKIHDYERPDSCHCDTHRERQLKEKVSKLTQDLEKVKECRDLLKDTIRSLNKFISGLQHHSPIRQSTNNYKPNNQ